MARRHRAERAVGIALIVGALASGGWVVNLGLSLSDHAVAYRLPVVKAALAGLLLVAVLLVAVPAFAADPVGPPTGAVGTRWSPAARAAGIGSITLVVVIEWFLVVSGIDSLRATDTVFAVVAPVAVAAVLLTGGLRQQRVLRRIALGVGTGGLVLAALALVVGSAPTLIGHEQRVIWVGLDVAEMTTVLLVGRAVLRRRPALGPASCGCTLYLCDAVVNVGVARGHALSAAVVMACIEIPVALLLIMLGIRSERLRPITPLAGDRRSTPAPIARG